MIKCNKWQASAAAVLTTMLAQASIAYAQAPNVVNPPQRDLGASVISTVIFGLLGIVLAIVGFKLFDVAVKFDFEKEICEKQNLAVAILCGFMVLGICIIIAATVAS